MEICNPPASPFSKGGIKNENFKKVENRKENFIYSPLSQRLLRYSPSFIKRGEGRLLNKKVHMNQK